MTEADLRHHAEYVVEACKHQAEERVVPAGSVTVTEAMGAVFARAWLAEHPAAAAEPVTAAHLREFGFDDSRHDAAFRRWFPDGPTLCVWPGTGGVEVSDGGRTVRLIESGCTLGRLRQLVAALEGV